MAKILTMDGLSHFKTKMDTWIDNTFLKKNAYEAPTVKTVKVDGTPLVPDGSKAVNIQLGKYAIKTEVTQEIAQAVSGIQSFESKVVEQLPPTGESRYLYLVTRRTEDQSNVYDEYLWVNSKFEPIGTREINLSEYALKSEVPTKTSQLTNDAGFIKNVPAEYVTDSELTAKGYITGALVDAKLEDYATKAEIPQIVAITNTEIDALFSA